MDYKKAQTYWEEKDKDNIIMEDEKLKEWLDNFLKSHNTLALATASDSYIDNTPLEYNYVDNRIYIFTEGGHKFIGLEKNKNVSICIFDNYSGFGTISSCQIYGTCELVGKESEEYYKLLDYKKIPRTMACKLSLYLLRIDAEKIQILASEFKKMGYSNRQTLKLK